MKNWFLILVFLSFPAFGVEGLIAVKSAHSAKDTMDRLEYLAVRHGVAQCSAAAALKKALAGFAQQAIS